MSEAPIPSPSPNDDGVDDGVEDLKDYKKGMHSL